MRNLLLLLLLAFTVNAYSQHRNDDGVYGSPFKKKKEVTVKSSFEQAGIYLDKYSKYQYGVLDCTAFATGLFVWYGCTSEKFELNDEGKSKLTDKSKDLIIGGSVLGLIAIILEANAIEYKIKAGKCLRLQSDGNGAGLAFVF